MLRLGSVFNKHQLTKLSNSVKSAVGASNARSRRDMCGLVAAIDDVWTPTASFRDDVPILDDREVLRQTTRILDHRGPDGYQISTGTLGGSKQHARWSMGHTRLAIVDPSNRFADMPFNLKFKSQVGEKIIHLAANGEIYNHEKVYKNLVENDGWDQSRISGSDCEVIAHAYAKYGGPKTAATLDGYEFRVCLTLYVLVVSSSFCQKNVCICRF
jgi:asparagine synthetase B (glutamine-hydrolysing)